MANKIMHHVVIGENTYEIVDQYAREHGGVTIDSTLTQSGQAADAKATGDAIGELNECLISIGYTEAPSANILNPDEVEAGRITSSSSAVLHTGTYDTDYRTTGFMPVEAGKKYGFYVKHPTLDIIGIGVPNIWAYDANKDALSYLGAISYNADALSYVTIHQNASYIRASIDARLFTTYSIIMCSEADGINAPTEVVSYTINKYLDGYVQDGEFDAVANTVSKLDSIIDDNFVPVYSEIDGGTKVYGKYLNGSGAIADITNQNYSVLTLNVTPFASYKISGRTYQNNYYFAFHDSDGNFISGQKAPSGTGTTSITDVLVTAPADAVTVSVASDTNNNIVKGISGYIDSAAVPYTGKKWSVVGDSLTQVNEATTKHYFDYISDASGIDTYNMGVGGTGYARGYDNSNAFYQRISSVPTDSDVVTIFGSGNDMNIEAMPMFDGVSWSDALGTYTDTGTTTICGCINTALDNYFTVMPTVPIGIIAPTPWQSYPTTKLTNNRFEDYTNALEQIAKYRGVPFLDLYHHSNLRPENEANRNACFYSGASLDGNGDGVHPNELGHKIIAPKIYEFVKTMLLD